jgi:hypothetical protein
MKMTKTKAFATFGARPKNVGWASSAIAGDGSLLLSCWKLFLKQQPEGLLRYKDHLARWVRKNDPGKKLLREHLEQAIAGELDLRLVVATPKNAVSVIAGKYDGTRSTFSAHEEFVGKIVKFDGNKFVIDFRKR